MKPQDDISERFAILEKKFGNYLWLFRGVAIIGLGWLAVIMFLLILLALRIEELKT